MDGEKQEAKVFPVLQFEIEKAKKEMGQKEGDGRKLAQEEKREMDG